MGFSTSRHLLSQDLKEQESKFIKKSNGLMSKQHNSKCLRYRRDRVLLRIIDLDLKFCIKNILNSNKKGR
ncbi:MAG: DUF7301 family protein [Plesiomonas sp.]|uniref:DUF7301 family protein n=1 Tax=Plesiomonas sp. TaxID=2486279 RepID=UPI003F2A8FFE